MSSSPSQRFLRNFEMTKWNSLKLNPLGFKAMAMGLCLGLCYPANDAPRRRFLVGCLDLIDDRMMRGSWEKRGKRGQYLRENLPVSRKHFPASSACDLQTSTRTMAQNDTRRRRNKTQALSGHIRATYIIILASPFLSPRGTYAPWTATNQFDLPPIRRSPPSSNFVT